MPVDCSKKLFLSNPKNKQQFINMLGSSLSSAGYNVTLHENGADVERVDQALDLLKNSNVHIISDDTDVFIILLAKVCK